MTNPTNPTLQPSDEFCAQIHAHVADRLKALSNSFEYRSEQLCGTAYWAMLTSGQQKQAGKCIRKLAELRLLPLDIVKRRHEYPLVFRIIQ